MKSRCFSGLKNFTLKWQKIKIMIWDLLIKCKISLTALRLKHKIERGYFPMVKRDFVKYNRSLRTQQSFGDVMFP